MEYDQPWTMRMKQPSSCKCSCAILCIVSKSVGLQNKNVGSTFWIEATTYNQFDKSSQNLTIQRQSKEIQYFPTWQLREKLSFGHIRRVNNFN